VPDKSTPIVSPTSGTTYYYTPGGGPRLNGAYIVYFEGACTY
jgi:hypothetical protein